MIQRVHADHESRAAPTVGAKGGSLPSRVSSRSESGTASRSGFRRGSLTSPELEVFVLARKSRVGQLFVLEVVRFLEAVGKGGAEPGLIISLNICSATIRCPSWSAIGCIPSTGRSRRSASDRSST